MKIKYSIQTLIDWLSHRQQDLFVCLRTELTLIDGSSYPLDLTLEVGRMIDVLRCFVDASFETAQITYTINFKIG